MQGAGTFQHTQTATEASGHETAATSLLTVIGVLCDDVMMM